MLLAALVGAGSCECRDRAPAARATTVEQIDPALAAQLAAAVALRGPDYKPRTRHLRADGTPKFTNRLILETSPYLNQHAHNPVHWYAWGEAAFERARTLNKPIFLSIGYSTCHWCHVMEEESFEDEEIAGLLNRHFVAIKVDREERPDLDGIYLAAVRRMTGDGGWPLTVFLLPDRRPFFGGTYFPPRDGGRGARVGLLTLLQRLHEAYDQDASELTNRAATLVSELEAAAAPAPAGDLPGPATIRAAVAQFATAFDRTWGGFGGAPKFPRPAVLELLLRSYRRTGDAATLDQVTRTLERMAAGGIYDHVGGGFHRYSVDAKWRVPHFEKMLYDNAQLALIYVEAYQVTGRAEFARVARETLDYVLRELTSPAGGFYSATDADSEGAEGTYFVWSAAELEVLLGAADARTVREYFDVTAGGNFERGKNILWRPAPLAEVAARLRVSEAAVTATIASARPRLLEARSKRIPPLTDRKILVAWNGLMISALARAALVFDEPRYREAARAAAAYVMASARGTGRLRHAATAGGDAFLDDYAFLVAGLLDLHEADPDLRWLREAITLQQELDAGFADPAAGGYFFTSTAHEKLMVREKPEHDDALPAGNSVAALNLLRLHEATSDDRYRVRAEATFRAFARPLARAPTTLPRMLVALDFYLDKPKQVVIVTPATAEPPGTETHALLARFRQVFVPNRVLLRVTDGTQATVVPVAPIVEGKVARRGVATAYVCVGTYCEQPTTDPDVFQNQLAKVEPLAP